MEAALWIQSFAGFFAVYSLWILAGLLSLRPLPAASSTPDVTIVVAARNEAERLPGTLAQLQPYTVLVAEGPSTDGTRALVPPGQLVPLNAVPPGWVGKCHALWTAAQTVNSEWLLFLDADIHVKPGTIESAVAYAEKHQLNHLILHPGQHCETVWGRAALLVIGQGTLVFSPPWAIRRGWSYGGIGAFQLVRRDAYMAAGGHAAIRAEIVDDVALAKLVRKSVHLSGTTCLEASWAESLPGAIQAMEKNGFAATGYRTFVALAGALFFMIATGAAAVGWAIGAPWVTGAWLLMMIPSLVQVALRRGFGPASSNRSHWTEWLAAVLTPLAFLVIPAILLRSFYVTKRRGIQWRGSTYR